MGCNYLQLQGVDSVSQAFALGSGLTGSLLGLAGAFQVPRVHCGGVGLPAAGVDAHRTAGLETGATDWRMRGNWS